MITVKYLDPLFEKTESEPFLNSERSNAENFALVMALCGAQNIEIIQA